MRHGGRGGFFISNRAVDGNNLHNIYSFPQEPYVFDTPGNYLVERVPGGNLGAAAAVLAAAPPVVERPIQIDTIFITGDADEQIQAALQQRDIQINQLTQDLATTRQSLVNCQAGLAQAQAATPAGVAPAAVAPTAPPVATAPVAAEPVATAPVVAAPVVTPTPTPVAATSTERVFRVQVAAARRMGDFRATFAALHQAMPHLQLETIHDADGYFRYVTLPFATFAEADAIRMQIQALGYQCFVGGYRGNQRVSISVR
jgi:hypothetical protein